MNDLAQTRTTRLEGALGAGSLLPAMLGVNTLALVAMQHLGLIPDWIRTAAALFLAF
jgi:hypothetical protein